MSVTVIHFVCTVALSVCTAAVNSRPVEW